MLYESADRPVPKVEAQQSGSWADEVPVQRVSHCEPESEGVRGAR